MRRIQFAFTSRYKDKRSYRKKIKGKEITGFSIENKLVIADLFGKDGENRKTTRYNVKVDNDSPAILIIYKGD